MEKAEYIYLHWGDIPDFEVIRGHVHTSDALEILKNEGLDMEHGWQEVKQAYGRWIPTPHNPDIDMSLKIVSKPARGAFPVTLFYY